MVRAMVPVMVLSMSLDVLTPDDNGRESSEVMVVVTASSVATVVLVMVVQDMR